MKIFCSCVAIVFSCLLATSCGVLSGASSGGKSEVALSFHEEAGVGDNAGLVNVVVIPETNLRIPIDTFPIITERDLVKATYQETVAGPAIALEFDPHGTFMLDHATTRGRDRYLVICINDNPIAAWYVNKRITDGKFVLFAHFTEDTAKQYIAAWEKQIKKNLAL
jgi:hypothetical protein